MIYFRITSCDETRTKTKERIEKSERKRKFCWFSASIPVGLIWPIEISFGLQFVRIGMSRPEKTCLFRLKFTPRKKINRKENLCSAPSFMRKWTRPFIIQPNYVQSKTVYLPRTRNTRLTHTVPYCNIYRLIEPPHGQSKLFCINLCFRIFFSLPFLLRISWRRKNAHRISARKSFLDRGHFHGHHFYGNVLLP